MKKKLKLIFLLFPLIVLIIYSIYGSTHRKIIAKNIIDLDDLKWGTENNKLTINSKTLEKGELLTYSVVINKEDGSTLYKTIFEIDRDMFGGGFVKAMQVDDDPEMEMVFWRFRDDKFYLDLYENGINKISFEKANSLAKKHVEKWHRYNVIQRAEFTILIIMSFMYYVLFFIVYILAKAFNFIRKK